MNMLIELVAHFARELTTPEVLINLTIKTSLILAVTGLLTVLLHRSSAALRHWFWSIAFLSVLLVPLLSSILPGWQVPVLPISLEKSPVSQQLAPIADANNKAHLRKQTGPVDAWDYHVPATSILENPASSTVGSTKNVGLFEKINWPIWGLLIWAAGALFFFARTFLEILGLIWIAHHGKFINEQHWLTPLQEFQTHLEINRKTRVILSRYTSIPLTFGLFRPIILVPQEARQWRPEQIRTVLLHELAHIKRLDYLTNLLTHFVCSLHWYNPLIWIAARQLHLERERASDDLVLREGTEDLEYANQLLEIARPLAQKSDFGHGVIAMASRSQIKKRMQYILAQKVRRHAMTRFSAIFSGLGVLILASSLAIMHLQAKQPAGDSDISAGREAKSIDKIIAELKSEDISVQKQAAWSLGEREDRQAVPALITALKDENPEIRAIAAWALGEIKDSRALSPLITAMQDPDIYTREMIIRAVGEFEDSQAIQPLLVNLDHPEPDVRVAALWALGEIGERKAFYDVAPMLKDGDTNVRVATLNTLYRIGCDPAFVAVTISLRDSSPFVRLNAAKVLGQFNDKPTNKSVHKVLLDYSSWPPKFMSDVFGKIENLTASEYLIQTLSDSEAAVRAAAVETLGKIGHPRAVKPLMDSLQDPDPDVRAMAVWALDEINL